MVHYCCVPQCLSKKTPDCEISFHKFTTNNLMVTKWLRAIKSGKRPTKFTKICGLHFNENDYKPSVDSDARRFLKPTAIPNQNLPKVPSSGKLVLRRARPPPKQRDPPRILETAAVDETEADQMMSEEFIQASSVPLLPSLEMLGTKATTTRDSSTQTYEPMKLTLFYDCLTEEQFNRYTGLQRNRFDVSFEFLNQTTLSKFDKYLTKRDQLILTLIKYKQNMLFSIIGDMYGLTLLTTRKIFVHWTSIMNAGFKSVDWWSLRYQNPTAYTIIIDCSEVKTNQSRKKPELNQALFSHYKNQNTLKYLVAVDEKGTMIYCSDVYCGSVSDRFIVSDCGLISKLTEGDIVLADRGFDISDLLEEKGVALNIPPFLRNKSQLTPQEVLDTRRIANRRILVERVIGLGKFNKILNNTIPSHLWPHVNAVIYVANMLINFKGGIV